MYSIKPTGEFIMLGADLSTNVNRSRFVHISNLQGFSIIGLGYSNGTIFSTFNLPENKTIILEKGKNQRLFPVYGDCENIHITPIEKPKRI